MNREQERERLRAELTDGAGHEPPDFYIDRLLRERDEHRELPPPDMQTPPAPVHAPLPIAKHHRVWMEAVRTVVPCLTLVLQTIILIRQ